MIYRLKAKRQKDGKLPNYYNEDDIEEANNIIHYLESKGLYHYKHKSSNHNVFNSSKYLHRHTCLHDSAPKCKLFDGLKKLLSTQKGDKDE